MTNHDTICAVATAQGGAIGTIRVSGPSAIEITSSIFKPIKGKDLLDRKPYTLTFGNIVNKDGDIIDEVLVALFRAPHSYTGENSTEIMCHGSSYILQQVLQLLIKNGCRSANAGEFTQRAFLNGKMDLSQAEAVADLIASSNAASHKLAMSQMRGGFSKELTILRDKLLHITSLMELELDFSDHEDLEFADRKDLKELAANIESVITRLAKSFSVGNVIKNGIPVAIIGETNAGKSTLLNALLNEEKAIVSDIHGTTRDVIEDTMNIGGVTFRFIDTAGIRQTTDTIESIGIERTFQKLSQADIVLCMVDSSDSKGGFDKIKSNILPHCNDKKLIVVFNKSDLLTPSQQESILNEFAEVDAEKIFISAKNKENLNKLEEILVAAAALPHINQGDVIVTNIRHFEALSNALDSIHRVQEGMDLNLPGDLVSEDLRQCIFHLSDIVGEVTTDLVLQNIFKNFCIGK